MKRAPHARADGEDTLVLGVDIHLALLRLARRAAAGVLSYPRRRIGIVYDRRRFPVPLPGADRVDFWACDALALPFGPNTLKWSWLLISCLWPVFWVEWTRASIRRKLQVADWPKQLYL